MGISPFYTFFPLKVFIKRMGMSTFDVFTPFDEMMGRSYLSFFVKVTQRES